ncbi:hypothetical protein [Kribbella aluminosa]|uniref:hypothetical protein n=1 Tax=Kribbella aluminosa TaxID=416017 RepID=UPI0031E0C791
MALGGFGAGLLGLIGLVRVEPEDLGRAEVTMNLEKIVNTWPEGDAWVFAEPLEYDPSVALLVDRELDANGNNPGSDAAGWIALAEQLESTHHWITAGSSAGSRVKRRLGNWLDRSAA